LLNNAIEKKRQSAATCTVEQHSKAKALTAAQKLIYLTIVYINLFVPTAKVCGWITATFLRSVHIDHIHDNEQILNTPPSKILT